MTLNIFTPKLDFTLYEQMKTAMKIAGFGYDSGGTVASDRVYPYKVHWYQDYAFVQQMR